jgi:hypothetical protein
MKEVIATCGGSNCPLSYFPWLWWGVSVVVVYLVGWFWYSKFFTKSWIESEQIKCKCGADLAKGERCTCEKMSFIPMLAQLLATALIGFVFFCMTAMSVWFAVIVAIAVLGWEKANVLFRVTEFKRARKIIWIEVGYYCVALLIFILIAACSKYCVCGI